jgi:DNA-directed RNA polymerase specialized sigma24 family protein
MKNQFDLFDEKHVISSDLEWMLKSNQVGNQTLVDRLLAEFYQPVYQLARAYFSDETQASQAVKDVFVTALLNAEGYRESMGVEKWLYGIVKKTFNGAKYSFWLWKEVLLGSPGGKSEAHEPLYPASRSGRRPFWRIFHRTLQEERLVVAAHCLLRWDVEKIADYFALQSADVREWVNGWYRELSSDAHRDSGPVPEDLEVGIAHTVLERWKPREVDQETFKSLRREVIAASGRRHRISWVVRSIKLMTVVVGMIALILAVVWMQLPGISEPQPGQNPAGNSSPVSTDDQGDNGLSSTQDTDAGAQPSLPYDRNPVGMDEEAAAPMPTPTFEGLVYSVEFGDTLDSVASKLRVSVEDLRRVNRIPTGEDLDLRDYLLLPQDAPPANPNASPAAGSQVPMTPLNPTASSEEIKDFILAAHRSNGTFWMDAQVLISEIRGADRGTDPQPYRVQLWMSPDRTLVVGGAPGGDPEQVVLWVDRKEYIAMPGKGQPWYQNLYQGSGAQINDYRFLSIFQLFFPFDWDKPQDINLRIADEELVAGRPAWVVERLDQDGERTSRLWVDQERGAVLGFKVTDPRSVEGAPGSRVSLREIRAVKIEYDVNFPSRFFDPAIPWVGGFALDHTGKPIPASQIERSWGVMDSGGRFSDNLPPDDFDPTRAELSFRFPLSYRLATYFGGTDIFADGYYLGQADLGIPWNIWCQRSPDGSKIAFLDPWRSEPGGIPAASSGPYWFSLLNPQDVHAALPSAVKVSSYYAFSPDSRYLAFWGCNSSLEDCGVYLHDTKTLKNKQLLKLTHGATYFTWSPDGNYLAMLGANQAFFVLRVADSEIVYKGPYEPQVQSVPPDAPVYRWGVEFPPEMGSLESCSSPPLE